MLEAFRHRGELGRRDAGHQPAGPHVEIGFHLLECGRARLGQLKALLPKAAFATSPCLSSAPCAALPAAGGAASLLAPLKANTEVRIYMLRRISTVAAAAAMLALSALPVSAATMQSNTHKLSFPGLHGLNAWGNYTKTGSKVKVNVCAEVTVRRVFAAGAVTLESNASNSHHSELGAVGIGYHQTVCRSETLHYTSHLRVYSFIGTNRGTISAKTKTKTIY